MNAFKNLGLGDGDELEKSKQGRANTAEDVWVNGLHLHRFLIPVGRQVTSRWRAVDQSGKMISNEDLDPSNGQPRVSAADDDMALAISTPLILIMLAIGAFVVSKANKI